MTEKLTVEELDGADYAISHGHPLSVQLGKKLIAAAHEGIAARGKAASCICWMDVASRDCPIHGNPPPSLVEPDTSELKRKEQPPPTRLHMVDHTGDCVPECWCQKPDTSGMGEQDCFSDEEEPPRNPAQPPLPSNDMAALVGRLRQWNINLAQEAATALQHQSELVGEYRQSLNALGEFYDELKEKHDEAQEELERVMGSPCQCLPHPSFKRLDFATQDEGRVAFQPGGTE